MESWHCAFPMKMLCVSTTSIEKNTDIGIQEFEDLPSTNRFHGILFDNRGLPVIGAHPILAITLLYFSVSVSCVPRASQPYRAGIPSPSSVPGTHLMLKLCFCLESD